MVRLQTFLDICDGIGWRHGAKYSRTTGLNGQAPIDHKDGTICGRILKTVNPRGNQLPGTQIQIAGIRGALEEFAWPQQEGAKFREMNYQRKNDEI